MKSYRVHMILLGIYDVILVVDAENTEQAARVAFNQLKIDRLYREGRTEVMSID